MFIEEGLRSQDHSRCAESALDPPFFNKGFLKRMKFSIKVKTFNGSDFLTLNIGR